MREDGTPAEAHLHAMLCCRNARYISAVAKALGDKEQYLQKWDGEANNGHAYLIHATSKARKAGKHPYDPSAVVANFDFPERIKAIVTEIEQAKAEHQGGNNIKAMLDALYVEAITKDEIERQLSGSQYAKYHRQIDDVNAKRLVWEAEKWRAEMRAKGAGITVIWITGPAGAGKTSLAKDYAEKNYYRLFSGHFPKLFRGAYPNYRRVAS
nr:Rep family protein [uncultured Oscillibacter sp.]